ncbi:hypothetical protein HIM_00323 [Hirsutella minnesotensis 3608]|nr:hypothetical protein HIM_00323 [Hirsutella minnesotensis 3608]
MASAHLTASLNFLTDAAHLLRGTAPETSAHLMRHRADLVSHADATQHELHRQHVCSACGHIMMPGRGTTVKLEARRPRQLSRARKGQVAGGPEKDGTGAQGPSKVISCGRCQRLTKIDLPAPEPPARRKHPRLMPATAQATAAKEAEAPDAAKKSANASSKKRAKNRKAGLQELLSRQQQISTKSLTLADFVGK